jgi:exonuclease VII small subunit
MSFRAGLVGASTSAFYARFREGRHTSVQCSRRLAQAQPQIEKRLKSKLDEHQIMPKS